MADIEQRRTAQTECAFTVGVALAGGAVGGFVFWLLPQISPATKANVQLSLIAAAKGQWPSLLAGTATGAGVLVALCVAALHVARQRHIESPPLHSSFAFLLLPLISVLWFTPLRTANFQMLIVFVFIVSVAACAARLAALLRIPASLDGQRVCRGVLVLVMVVYFVAFSFLSISKFDRMQCDLYDLGIHDSLTWHATRGRLFTDFRGPYDHFAPIVLTYVPLYFVWPSPKALLALQSLVLALGAWPLYQLARLRLQSALAGIVVATAYLLYPLLSRANLHDFHPELFAAPVFFMACWELWRERVRWFFLWVVVLLCVKEGMAVLVFALGLFILIGMRRRRLGAVVCLLAVVWSVWVLSIYFPLIVGAKFPHYGRYETMLSTDGGLVLGLWHRTTAALGSHFVWRTALLVLVPLGFLPLGSAWGFLCLAAIPMAEQFLSDNPPQQLLKAHYSAAIIGGILVATVLGLEAFIRRGERDQRLRFALAFLLTSALLSNYFFGDSPFHRYAHNDAVNYDYGLHGRLLSIS
ncbi:MAG: DUF2079 domain-containing protein, partial [Planctomycetes bacterium]|nr:DUF2079 domain-containing protein [Planctomycetota bacterium]